VLPTPPVTGGSVAASPPDASDPAAPPEISVPPDEPVLALPDPDGWIPRDPRRLAEDLEATRIALGEAIGRWKRDGDPGSWPPPADVEVLALHEQRIYRTLGRDERLAARVLSRLRGRPAARARANVRARAALNLHQRPIPGPITMRVGRPEPADTLLDHLREAESRFGVDWEVLAAVMLIETRMGRVVSRSSAGAQGPMQFLPSTWDAYGMGGDVHEERDAILGAANYLRASGAPGDYRLALYRYNPLRSYVTAVTAYASVMRRDPDAFYAYYNWQVFVRTRHRGDVRLSGPGR
jgi:hypothetical protein